MYPPWVVTKQKRTMNRKCGLGEMRLGSKEEIAKNKKTTTNTRVHPINPIRHILRYGESFSSRLLKQASSSIALINSVSERSRNDFFSLRLKFLIYDLKRVRAERVLFRPGFASKNALKDSENQFFT